MLRTINLSMLYDSVVDAGLGNRLVRNCCCLERV